jgi:DNA-binding NtrC family response regulator
MEAQVFNEVGRGGARASFLAAALANFAAEGIEMTTDLRALSYETANEAFLERHLPGTSSSVVALRRLILKLNSPRNAGLVNVILITGESGAGKNHVARVIAGHRRWLEVRQNRAESPGIDAGLDAFLDRFEEVHLPALPETLIESELFGAKRGGFTGATQNRPGILGGPGRAAHEKEPKDLLLDEIGDATKALQAKLLQVVAERRFRPVGGGWEDYYETSARLLMATNRDLQAMVPAGDFREDLLWRLREFVVAVPPLREQPDNVEPIARRLEEDLRATFPVDYDEQTRKLKSAKALTDDDWEWARSYEWPGNVRQLRQAIRRWYFDEGESSLKETVATMRADDSSSARHSNASISALVRRRLDECLNGNGLPPGSLNGLLKEFAREIQVGVNDWYRAEDRSDDDLRKLFPDNQPMSVRNKLSNWRRR